MAIPRSLQRAWLAAVAAVAVVPAVAVLAAGHTLAWRDTARLHAPLRPLVVHALRGLRLPLWNPHEALGTPLFAQLLHGVLHPVSVLGAFLAPGVSIDAILVVHIGLAAAGAAVLARGLGASRGASAVAGLGYAMSGPVLGMTSNVTYLAAAGTAPWAIAALRGRPSRPWGPAGVALAAAGVAALHFAGDPQWTAVAVALGLALAAERGGARALFPAGAGVALGTALAAVQLWPAWVLVGVTNRGAALEKALRTQWSFSPSRSLELAVPGVFGRAGVSASDPVFRWLGGPTVHDEAMPFAPSVYLGGVLLALAILGIPGSRAGRVLAGAAGVLLWIALGEVAGADAVLHHLPVWGAFRYPEKLVVPLTLCVAILAALGADRLAEGRGRRTAAAALAVAAGCAALGLLFTSADVERLASSVTARAGIAALRPRLAMGFVNPALALAALGGVLLARVRRGGPWLVPALAALIAIEAAAAAPFALHAGTPGLTDRPPDLGAFRGTPARIATPTGRDPYPVRADLDDTDGIAEVEALTGVAAYPARFGIDQLDAYSAFTSRAFEDLGMALAKEFGPERWVAYRRYAVTHVAVVNASPEATIAIAGGRLAHAEAGRSIGVFEVPHRPWVTFAGAIIGAPTHAAAVAATIGALRRGDPSVVVEGGAPPPAGAGEVLSAARGRERVRVEAVSAAPGTLVVNDAFWPGWRATLDGADVPILRADALVRAVPWPGGRHVLEMRYEPPEVKAGALVSAAALLATLGLALVAGIRARRGRGGAR
ncbi:MAG TPA: hypothetical protein VF841_15910 [Anaeromyxobacter sp.]